MIKRLINWYNRPVAAALYTATPGQRVIEQSTLTLEQILNHIDGLRDEFLLSGKLPSDVTSVHDLAGWLDDIAYTTEEFMADIEAARK